MYLQILLESDQVFGKGVKKILKAELPLGADEAEDALRSLRQVIFDQFLSDWLAVHELSFEAEDERFELLFFDSGSTLFNILEVGSWEEFVQQEKKRIEISVRIN